MRKLKLWQHLGMGCFIAAFMTMIGLAWMPSSWVILPGIFVGIWFIFFMANYGWNKLTMTRLFNKTHVKALTMEQGEKKIRQFAWNNDYILPATPPKFGYTLTKRIAGERKVPFYIMRTPANMSTKYPCDMVFICDSTTGDVVPRVLDGDFSWQDMDNELEKMAGQKTYIQRIEMPEPRGPVYTKQPFVEEAKESGN